MVIILYVRPVPDKRHLMTKMSSMLRRPENCRRGRKAEFPLRVLLVTFIARSSQLFAHPLARRRLHWTLFNTRSRSLCIALQQISTRLDSKMLNYLLFVANISQEEVVTSFYLHSCYVAAGQASMHLRPVLFANLCLCLPNTRATTRTTWQCKCAPCTAAEELVATSSLFLDRLNLNLKCNHHPSTTL